MTDRLHNTRRLAFMGFGEAAQAFVSGWALERPERVAAFDIKTDDPALRTMMQARYGAHGVSGKLDVAEALGAAEMVFSLVTADQALAAARSAERRLPPGALWLDCNSCAPGTKRRAAAIIEGSGGHYVDVAVMAPVHPNRHRAPLLLAGAEAERAAEALEALGMLPRVVGPTVGDASSIKMIRSVMIKGIEAVTAECFLAARRAGVEAEVIASLEASDPALEWPKRGAYNLERMMVHGARRAAEMREVALTVAELGLPGRMSAAAAEWQDDVAAPGLEGGPDDLLDRADRILAALPPMES